jgi:hypothetical protein
VSVVLVFALFLPIPLYGLSWIAIGWSFRHGVRVSDPLSES